MLKLFGQLLRTNFRKEETNAHIEHLISEIRDQYIDEIEGKITISIGICFAPENGSTFMDLYRCADRALYQTKQNGATDTHSIPNNKNIHFYQKQSLYFLR